MYAIKRIDQGGSYLCYPHGKCGTVWGFHVERIRTFATRESAEAARCPENEIVVPFPAGRL